MNNVRFFFFLDINDKNFELNFKIKYSGSIPEYSTNRLNFFFIDFEVKKSFILWLIRKGIK